MKFDDPYWLLAGLLICSGLIVIWERHDVRQRAALERFLAPHLRRRLTSSVSDVRRWLQRSLLLGSVAAVCVALAGPLLGYHWETIHRRGNEVIFAIDTSRSMLTPDVRPNRLARAKLAIDDMARQLDGDAIGIVAFAGSAFLVCPLTLDPSAFHQSLAAIDVHTIPRGGTDIPSAILAARAALSRRPGSDRILILVTDGENLEGDALAAARDAATQDGLKIYTVGVGTAQGDLIPLPWDQGGGFVRDQKGAPVRSRLDQTGLTAISASTSGAYVHLGDEGQDFEAFLSTAFGSVTKHDLSYRQRKIYNQRYQWPLSAAVVMLLAALMLGTRRGRRHPASAMSRAVAVSAVSMAMGLLIIAMRSEGAGQASDRDAMHAAGAPIVKYNAGTTAYRAGQFSQAAQSFLQSIEVAPGSDAKRLADQEDAYYDLGNALYRTGQQFEKSAPQQAIDRWTEAVKAYDTALQLRPDDFDSKFNRDFVQRRIDALRQPPPDQGGGGGSGSGNGGGQGQSHGGGQGRGSAQGQGQGQGQNHSQGQGSGGGNGHDRGEDKGPRSGNGGGRGPSPGEGEAHAADNQRPSSGQMSVEEARELLDSAKSDEHQSLAVAPGSRAPNQNPDRAFKDW